MKKYVDFSTLKNYLQVSKIPNFYAKYQNIFPLANTFAKRENVRPGQPPTGTQMVRIRAFFIRLEGVIKYSQLEYM